MEPAWGSRAGGPTPGGGAWGALGPAAQASEPRTERPRALALSFPLAPGASGPCPASRPHQPAAPRTFLNQKKRDIGGESGLSTVRKQACGQSFPVQAIIWVQGAWRCLGCTPHGRGILGQSLGIRAALPRAQPAACPLPGRATRGHSLPRPPKPASAPLLVAVSRAGDAIGSRGPPRMARVLSSAAGVASAERVAGDGAARCGSRN